jgi:hypothetical protein
MKKISSLSLLSLIFTFLFISCSEESLQFELKIIPSEGGIVNGQEGLFESGTLITLTAVPNEGFGFVRWQGVIGSESQLTLTLDRNTNVTAIFAPVGTYDGEEFIIYDVDSSVYNASSSLHDPDFNLITSSNYSYLKNIDYTGTQSGEFFYDNPDPDRSRIILSKEIVTHNFIVSFYEGHDIEFIVDSGLTLEEAKFEVDKLAFSVGQLPNELRKGVFFVWLASESSDSGGWAAKGGGPGEGGIVGKVNSIYESQGTIEEMLIHEATHSSSFYFNNWYYLDYFDAMELDDCFLSDYARNYPTQEDLAEFMVYYIALKYFPNEISKDLRDIILSCSFNRIKYLDSLGMDLSVYEN